MGNQNLPVGALYNPAGLPGSVVANPPGTGIIIFQVPGSPPQKATLASLTQDLPNPGGTGTATAVAGAATLNEPAGQITSEALTGATTYSLTLTNSFIKAGSIVMVDVFESTHAAGVALLNKTVTAGQVVIAVSMAALTGTLKFDVAVLN